MKGVPLVSLNHGFIRFSKTSELWAENADVLYYNFKKYVPSPCEDQGHNNRIEYKQYSKKKD